MLPPDPVREPPKYIPPVSKPWVSQGSEKEINEMSFTPRRPLLKYNIKVLRESLNRPAKLNDEVSTKHQITIASYEDLNFLTKMIEFEKGVQAAPNFVENTAQTVWRYPKNATTQYESRYLKDTERKEELKKEFAEEMEIQKENQEEAQSSSEKRDETQQLQETEEDDDEELEVKKPGENTKNDRFV